jgi:serine phosphatase RsbU (regulator of sigma subunit)
MSATPPLLLAADAASNQNDVRTALDRAGLEFKPWSLQTTIDPDPAGIRLAIVDSAGAVDAASAFCQRWRTRQSDGAPILWMANAGDSKLAGWQAGAEAVFQRPFEPAELTAQVSALRHVGEERERLTAFVAGSRLANSSTLQLFEQSETNATIARRIQASFRPSHIPSVEEARFAVSRRERDGGGGDFHAITRLDEEHVAFFLGDVMGSGLTPSLLATFIHQNIVSKQIHGRSYRLLLPREVLDNLNGAVASLGLAEPPLARLIYALFNAKSGALAYACAGHTPPLHVPRKGPLAFWPAIGAMLGEADANFPPEDVQLEAGDRLLLFTDGLVGTHPKHRHVLRAAVENRRELPLPALVEYVTQDLLTQTPEPDDFTMLGLEYS